METLANGLTEVVKAEVKVVVDEIEKYEYWDDMLVVWFEAKWIGGENDD
mgnify:CR=1 FL=1